MKMSVDVDELAGYDLDMDSLPSALHKSRQQLSDFTFKKMIFLSHFVNASWTPEKNGVDGYIQSTDVLKTRYGSSRIVYRSCYSQMEPTIEEMTTHGQKASVSGAAGIGKTIFGLFLVRSFVKNGRSVVYWNEDQATLFTKDEALIAKYGLEDKCVLCGEEWHWGAWEHNDAKLAMFLVHPGVSVIHDPKKDFIDGGNEVEATNVVYIVPFGHALKGHWATQLKGAPDRDLPLPVFDLQDIVKNKSSLFHGKDMDKGTITKLYRKYGGNIRFWGTPQEDTAWANLKKDKATNVAKSESKLAVRTAESKENIFHC